MRRAVDQPCEVESCGRNKDSRRGRFCSRHRYLMDRYGSTDEPASSRPCAHCGAEFVTTRSRARFCQESCRRAQERIDRAARNASRCRVWVGRCGVCGVAFVSPTADGPSVRMCSDECRKSARRSAERIRERTRDEVRPVRAVFEVEALPERGPIVMFTRAEIADRDGWVCQVCGEPVDPSLRWPHPMSQALGHVIPRSRGGAHSPDNCQLIHLSCNPE